MCVFFRRSRLSGFHFSFPSSEITSHSSLHSNEYPFEGAGLGWRSGRVVEMEMLDDWRLAPGYEDSVTREWWREGEVLLPGNDDGKARFCCQGMMVGR